MKVTDLTSSSQILQHAVESTISFSEWFDQKVVPLAKSSHPLELAGWRKELDHIRSLVEKPNRLRIALVGTTGAGKSTLLNAVLGQVILPVGVMQPCTAFVTTVKHAAESEYRVRVQFCTSEEWQKDLENIVAALKPGELEEEGDGRGETKRLMDAARKRVQAVYGDRLGEDADLESLLSATPPAEVIRVFSAGSSETNRFDDAKAMLSYLHKLIRGESPLWPLVKEVNISGPYACLAGGFELVDLPGLNDPNEARVEVTRKFLRTSPFVWVVFNMVRGLTEDIQRVLRDEKLLRTLVLSGSYGALSLVGTKADEIDTNVCSQFNLPEDCSISELVQAYRHQTVKEVRKQLEQMIRDLASQREGGEALSRMIDMARRVTVHTTSANAYIKLKRIGRLRKDYGLNEEQETGIPDIHKHLTEIGKEAGAAFNAQTALKRLDQLRDEIAFFFRARAQAPTAKMEEARARFAKERDAFSEKIRDAQRRANDQLKTYRERFLEKIDPLFSKSVQGVRRATEGWRAIHWATLRAIIQRNGSFRSPTTGRSFDFNEDLADPLLAQLPLSWEQYFTDDLGRVAGEFVVRVAESGNGFCEKIQLITDLLFQHTGHQVKEQLDWFHDKVSLLSDSAKNRVIGAVRERRSELVAKMPLVARARMQPAYDKSKTESGTGMKSRILTHLEPTAVESAQPIYSTIQGDLLEGLNDLEVIIVGMLRDLTKAAEDQAQIIAHNANIDINEAPINPVLADLLNSIPK